MRGPPADAAPSDAREDVDGLVPIDRRTWAVAIAVFVVLMALSGLYGFHRDELYFLDAARHLQGGYVDQPILTPLLARMALSLFGVWLPGLRVWAALAVAATVVVGALLARELGGGRRAQLLAAIATATMPAVLGAGHLMGQRRSTFSLGPRWRLLSCASGEPGICAYGPWASLNRENGGLGNVGNWVVGQLIMASLALV
jgi:hypothetical protein